MHRNYVIITEIFPLGLPKEDAIAFAKKISFAMRCLWAGESPLKVDPRGFAQIVTLNTCIPSIEEKREIICERIRLIFTYHEIREIKKQKKDRVFFKINFEEFNISFEDKM